ncbi:uncharacterized protein [Miscanthus floridulus]|uniref:uncharacterized protein n=1 Tax=Miscanthus floridulus TaxID=154761 RepID=UPI00345750E2
MELSSPESIVEIEVEGNKKKRFKRIFVALKTCVDGFLAGCRLFVGVDATCLNGKYTRQLALATAVDGHNWKWFMEQLHKAIGSPEGLVICTDACKGLRSAVGVVFPQAECRECMRHLYSNFMKHYQGDVFTDHLYPAARSYTEGLFKWHMQKIFDVAPDAIEFLEQHHNRLWYRCGFSKKSKCDYLTNNVSESFNAQIRHMKGLLLHELVDGLRELIMEKRFLRRKIAREMRDGILPNVMKELNAINNNLKVVKISSSDEDVAEVTLLDNWNNQRRHIVDLQHHSCSCREWQLTGKPCKHALAWILSNRGMKIEDYVHEYYSVPRFRAAYEGRVEPFPDRTQWPVVDLGFTIFPPLLGRPPGRPRVQRIRGYLEGKANKKKVKCKRKRQQDDDTAGPSEVKKKKTAQKKKKSLKRKKTPKKKKTPVKKKQQKAATAPQPRVVMSCDCEPKGQLGNPMQHTGQLDSWARYRPRSGCCRQCDVWRRCCGD